MPPKLQRHVFSTLVLRQAHQYSTLQIHGYQVQGHTESQAILGSWTIIMEQQQNESLLLIKIQNR